MPDDGLDLEFGILPSPDASRHREVLEPARLDGFDRALVALADALLAHLSHEEEALHDPLALHGFG